MLKAIGLLVVFFALAACTVDDVVTREPPVQLAKESSITLCSVYYSTQDPKVKAELMSRKIIPDQDWSLIDQHQVAVGMYNYETIAAWGDPDDIRTRITQAGAKSRFIYKSCQGCHKTYLIFDTDGVLTTIEK